MMQVKRYTAPSYAEALIKAKNELGTDAIIVENKKVQVGGFLGFFSKTVTELTVAVDQPVAGNRPAAAASVASPAAVVPGPAPATMDNLEREMAALRSAVTRLADREAGAAGALQLRGFARRAYEELVARGVEEETALEIGKRIRGEGAEGWNQVREELARRLETAPALEVRQGQQRVIALVGPTGVGKTTTIAKLAAHFSMDRRLQVGLITSDTFRIAAVEQLRTYAEIMSTPFFPVDSPQDVTRALQEMSRCDLILVDTGGRNHRDPERMRELRETLALLRPDETHLVYSLTANPRDAYEALEHYLPLGVNRLSFTKLDEATSPGLILNMRKRCNQPLGYISHGQSVPDDIMPAGQTDLTKILIGA
jgi:flagellar biosynthesis protein FlhF